jgi:hypothetical protein
MGAPFSVDIYVNLATSGDRSTHQTLCFSLELEQLRHG